MPQSGVVGLRWRAEKAISDFSARSWNIKVIGVISDKYPTFQTFFGETVSREVLKGSF